MASYAEDRAQGFEDGRKAERARLHAIFKGYINKGDDHIQAAANTISDLQDMVIADLNDDLNTVEKIKARTG